MRVKFDTSALGQTKWQQYANRFMFGGCITVAAGLVASKFGPAVGGLLLAFPAIFPASATLIEKHEKEKKEKQGLSGTMRGRQAASVDAAGSAMGSWGLLVFALLVWQFVPNHRAWIVLPGAMVAWLAVSVLIWEIRLHVRIVR
jgi:4-hydroxybenzoate polyprenyltransferase